MGFLERSPRPTPIGVAVSAGLFCGCSFSTSISPDGGVDVDVPPEAMAVAATCKELHTVNPTAPSANYLIDPDGAGGIGPQSVFCDMTTENGGWTVVFFPPTSNLTSLGTGYTVAVTMQLLASAQHVLIVYRDSAENPAGDFATFPIPNEWRMNAPFTYGMVDVNTMVSVGGAPAAPAMLRFGNLTFNGDCDDPWDAASGAYGRLCIVGTTAPFFTGFASSWQDTCPDSLSVWNARFCDNDRRFSIAIR